jgi:hypothetical protein
MGVKMALNVSNVLGNEGFLARFNRRDIPTPASVVMDQLRQEWSSEVEAIGHEDAYPGESLATLQHDSTGLDVVSGWGAIEPPADTDPYMVNLSNLTALRDLLMSGKQLTAKGSGIIPRVMSDQERIETLTSLAKTSSDVESKRVQVDISIGKVLDTLDEPQREAFYRELKRLASEQGKAANGR